MVYAEVFIYMRKIDPAKIKNVVISRTDRMGDVILTLPLVSECKRIFNEAKIWFLVSGYSEPLLRNYEGIDELIYIEDYPEKKDLKEFFKEKGIDLIIHAFPRPEISSAAYKAGIKYRVGAGARWYSITYNKRVSQHRSRCEKNEADYNLDLLDAIVDGVKYDKKYKFRFSDAEVEKFWVHANLYNIFSDDKYVIIHPGSGGSAKDLPMDKFAAIAERICELYPEYKIVITGTEAESILADEIMNEGCINMSGKLTLRELMMLINGCALFLANSTGPIHIAGAMDKEIIGFYPNSKPINATRWGPPGNSASVITPPEGSDEMNKIDVDRVIDIVKEKLN
ncbi:MAG TPA: glycosyltransferase family 9 protein [Ignavibacteria bacterium]|nr:glycosyltransferase family 9 protein [Ignavibacteria bacterium]